MLFLLALVFADPLHDCATALLAQAQPKLQEEIRDWGRTPGLSLEEREASLGKGWVSLLLLIERSARSGDMERAKRLLSRLETEMKALEDPLDAAQRDATLARGWFAVGDRENAARYLKSALNQPIPEGFAGSVLPPLLVASVVLGDTKVAASLEKALIADGYKQGPYEVIERITLLSRELADAGVGGHVLTAGYPAIAESAGQKLDGAEAGKRTHDDVLRAAFEGAERVDDRGVMLDLMSQYRDVSRALFAWPTLVVGMENDPRMPGWVAAILRAEAHADDDSRDVLVGGLARAGFLKEALQVTSRIQDPAMRARSQAEISGFLVLEDREAGLKLARGAAEVLAKLPDDPETRSAVVSGQRAVQVALARAGLESTAEPKYVAFGLVGDAARRQPWWAALDTDNRALVAAAADQGGYPWSKVDRAAWTEMCLGR